MTTVIVSKLLCLSGIGAGNDWQHDTDTRQGMALKTHAGAVASIAIYDTNALADSLVPLHAMGISNHEKL